MASGMKLWLAICLGGIAAAAVLLLPPRTAERVRLDRVADEPMTVQPANNERRRLFSEVSDLDRQLHLLRAQDALDARLEQARRDGETSFVVLAERIEADTEFSERFRQLFTAQVEELRGEGGRDVLVGALFLERDFRLGAGFSSSWNEFTYAGTLDDGTPYCARVVWAFFPSTVQRSVRDWSGGPADLCRHWARFGPPGPHVAEWLEDGGYALISAVDGRVAEELLGYELLPFGIDSPVLLSRTRRGLVHSAKACLEDPATCADMVLRPGGGANRQPHFMDDVRRATDLVSPEAVYWGSSIAEPSFLGEMERLEGEEAVRDFWTSDRPVADAFREATGSEVGPWLRSWIESLELPPIEATDTRMSLSTAGLSLLTLLAAAGVGLAVHLRREVA